MSCLSKAEPDTRMFVQIGKTTASRIKYGQDRRSRTSSGTVLLSKITQALLANTHAPGLAGDYPIKKKKKRRGLG
jgi:hypothetical protein